MNIRFINKCKIIHLYYKPIVFIIILYIIVGIYNRYIIDMSEEIISDKDCNKQKEELNKIYTENDCGDYGNEYKPKCNEFLLKKELAERECDDLDKYDEIDEDFFYPDLNDRKFNVKIALKKEFNKYQYDGELPDSKQEFMKIVDPDTSQSNTGDFELQPHQSFIRNFMSYQTPYNGILLYHGLGTGKTCSAIGVAEETRTYMKQMGIKKEILIVASKNVQDNFRLQLFDKRKLNKEGGVWNISSCIGNKLLREINPANMKNLTKEKVTALVESLIRKSYKFLGYIEFANYIIRTAKGYDIEDIEEIDVDETLLEKGFELNSITIKQLSKEFDGRLIIIDEIHNIRKTDENKENKKVAINLEKLVGSAHNMRLLLLSATPMYNSPKEIVWMLNLLNMNDRRGKIKIKDVFDDRGNLLKDGEEVLVRKSTGYVSFVRGENPYTFPYRIYPSVFSPENTFPLKKDIENNDFTLIENNNVYPLIQINGKEIKNRDRIISIYLTHLSLCGDCGECQRCGYQYIINSLKEKHSDSFEKMESFGYTLLQKPSESLIITYPSSDLKNIIDAEKKQAIKEKEKPEKKDKKRKQGAVDISTLTGAEGLKEVMIFKDTKASPKEKGSFEYKKDILGKYGRIFSKEKIGKYSAKIKKVLDLIISPESGLVSEGIILIYSQYLDAGIIPMALALEEAGFSRFSDFGAKNLFKNAPPTKKNKLTYSMITGDHRLSPNNDEEIKAITSENNLINGDAIKVVLISRAGSEGIDLKCIRQVHILDAWYNMNLIEQVVGRAVRNYSHKALDFEKRNVQIFLHGTLVDGTEEEAVDLYLYRTAETKAIQIGEVTRILKESSVDCIINHKQTNFSQEVISNSIGGGVKQILSDGQVINNFQIGDAPYSASNDYMPSGNYKCRPLLDKEDEMKIKQVIETENDEGANSDTYTEPFIMVNIDRIINKIKMLMKDRYFYKKKELFQLVSTPKKYSTIEIYAALSRLVEENSEIITDKYRRPGSLVNIGEYYLFQPIELKDKGLSIFERSVPVDYKHKMIRFDISDMKGIEEKGSEKEVTQRKGMEEVGEEEKKTNTKEEKESNKIFDKCMYKFLLVVKYYKWTLLRTERKAENDIDGGGRKKKDDKEREKGEKQNIKKEKLTDEQLWYKHFGELIPLMNSGILNMRLKEIFYFLTAHIIDVLLMEDKVKLLKFVQGQGQSQNKNIDSDFVKNIINSDINNTDFNNETKEQWGEVFSKLAYEYFDNSKIVYSGLNKLTKKRSYKEYQIFFTDKSMDFKLFVLDKKEDEPSEEKVWMLTTKLTDMTNVKNTEKYKENINVDNNRYSDIIGFIGFEKNKSELSFKTKSDMKEMTDKKRGNPGAKCDDVKKPNTIKAINQIVGTTFIKEDEKENDRFNKIDCCVLLETILRYKNSQRVQHTNDKIWFLTPEETLLHNLYKVLIKK